MIKLRDVLTESQENILKVFNPDSIKRLQRDLKRFNQKTQNFLKSI